MPMSLNEQIVKHPPETIWATPVLGIASALTVLSASCCVLPIGLTILGFGGNWLIFLGYFAAYRAAILIGVGVVLALVWARLMVRPGACATRRRTAFILASFCSVIFVAAVTAPFWEQDATRAMWTYWVELQ